MEIVLRRRIMKEMMNTFLPTILLILITYFTTFFKVFYFEAALTVNLITMLVMTTIFIAVMDKLPSTAYVKMIDVWLIFSQLIPFIEVLLLTFMEAYRPGDERGLRDVNNHGTARTVQVSPQPNLEVSPRVDDASSQTERQNLDKNATTPGVAPVDDSTCQIICQENNNISGVQVKQLLLFV